MEAGGITRAKLIDATPIGLNVRSTVATYANVHDELRKAFAKTPGGQGPGGYKAGDFSYNTGRLRCPTCDGTGSVSLTCSSSPMWTSLCPTCRGSRYDKKANQVAYTAKDGRRPTPAPEIMAMDIQGPWRPACSEAHPPAAPGPGGPGAGVPHSGRGDPQPFGRRGPAAQARQRDGQRAVGHCVRIRRAHHRPASPGRGYPLGVFQTLLDQGATVVVIEHDLDVIRSADYLIDLGPGGGQAGGRIVAAGTPAQVAACPESITGRYL